MEWCGAGNYTMFTLHDGVNDLMALRFRRQTIPMYTMSVIMSTWMSSIEVRWPMLISLVLGRWSDWHRVFSNRTWVVFFTLFWFRLNWRITGGRRFVLVSGLRLLVRMISSRSLLEGMIRVTWCVRSGWWSEFFFNWSNWGKFRLLGSLFRCLIPSGLSLHLFFFAFANSVLCKVLYCLDTVLHLTCSMIGIFREVALPRSKVLVFSK